MAILKRDIGYHLYKLGIDYHDYGIIKEGNKKLFDYYKVDKITEEQKTALKVIIPNVQFKSSYSEYAPEIKKALILIPTGKIK